MAPYQSGFRIKHSTTTTLLKITNDIAKELDGNKNCILVLLDFSKAFDSISHNILLDKLYNSFSFSSSACTLIRSYLSNHTQCVNFAGECSLFTAMPRGVPQGSKLGPLLFALFINDLPLSISSSSSYHLYADDLQFWISFELRCLSDAIRLANDNLSLINSWAELNELTLNLKNPNPLSFLYLFLL